MPDHRPKIRVPSPDLQEFYRSLEAGYSAVRKLRSLQEEIREVRRELRSNLSRAQAQRSRARHRRGTAEFADRLLDGPRTSIPALAGELAHFVNNPLSYVVANLGFAREELSNGPGNGGRDPQILQALAEAAEGAERIRLFVQDFHRLAQVLNGVQPGYSRDVRGASGACSSSDCR